MDERVMEFRLGALVLAAVILAGILAFSFNELPSFVPGSRYTLYIHFPEAPGVSADTPINKSGILIGRVTNVEFADAGGVLVTTAIDDEIKLTRDDLCRINGTLLGDAELQFVRRGDEEAATQPINAGDLLAGVVVSNPLEVVSNLEGSLQQTISSFAQTSDDLGRLARGVADLMERNEDQISRIVRSADASLESLQRVLAGAEDIFGDEETRMKLKEGVAALPEVLQETRRAIQGITNTIDSADRNLQNLEGLTRPLGQRGDEFVTRLADGARKLNLLLDDILAFSQNLQSPDGTLGQLLNNPDLYQNLNQAAYNVSKLTRELRPIINDARVITDKIARHPEDLGVRGAIRRRPVGIK